MNHSHHRFGLALKTETPAAASPSRLEKHNHLKARCTMGDKGKKDKDKTQKQKQKKEQDKKKKHDDKQRKPL
jgi:hypothetical protein